MSGEASGSGRRFTAAVVGLLVGVAIVYLALLFWATGVGSALGLAQDVNAQVALSRALSYAADAGAYDSAYRDSGDVANLAPLDPRIGFDAMGDVPLVGPPPAVHPATPPGSGLPFGIALPSLGSPTPSDPAQSPAPPTTTSPSPGSTPSPGATPSPVASPTPATSPSPAPPVTGNATGFVRDAAGLPLGGATVAAQGGPSATTAPDGSYALAGLQAAAPYTLQASLGGYQSQTANVTTDASGNVAANFTLTLLVKDVTGTVRTSNGGVLAGATVSVNPLGTPSATTTSTGAYSLNGLLPNTSYTLTASASGYGSVSSSLTTGGGGGGTLNFTLSSTMSGPAQGMVTDSNNSSNLGGATVTVPAAGLSTTTAGDGKWQLSGLMPNAGYLFKASAPGYATQQIFAITNSSGKVTNVNFGLFPAGSLSVQVWDNTGAPLSGVSVTAGALAAVHTQNTGRASLTGTSPGTAYSVILSKGGFASQTLNVTTDSTGAASVDATLLPTSAPGGGTNFTISGAVLDAATGQPITGAVITIVGVGTVTTDSNGSYTLTSPSILVKSSYTIKVAATGYPQQTVTILTNDHGAYTMTFHV